MNGGLKTKNPTQTHHVKPKPDPNQKKYIKTQPDPNPKFFSKPEPDPNTTFGNPTHHYYAYCFEISLRTSF